MSKYRLFSMAAYGVAALAGAMVMAVTAFTTIFAVLLPFAAAVAADRYINKEAEPDERLRSFVIYAIGAVAGLVMVLLLGSRLGWWTWIAPLVGFAVLAIVDYLRPPEVYQPRDRSRYGATPPAAAS